MILALCVENDLANLLHVKIHFFTYKTIETVSTYHIPSKIVKHTLPETFSINKQQYMYNIHSIILSEKNTKPIQITRKDLEELQKQMCTKILTIRITNVDDLYRVSFR